MRTPATVYLLVLVVGNGGCSSDGAFRLPTAPTPASAPRAESTAEQWTLTTTYLGSTGVEACPSLGSPSIGAIGHWTLTIDRSSERLVVSTVNLGNHNDRVAYAGTTDGEAFTVATGIGGGGPMTCGDTRVEFRDEVRVTGRFSDGGRSLVAEEVYSMWLASGATLTWHSEWRATRQ